MQDGSVTVERRATPRRGRSQAWSTFVRNHAQALLACDFMIVWPESLPYALDDGK
jgi:hypothetical protein